MLKILLASLTLLTSSPRQTYDVKGEFQPYAIFVAEGYDRDHRKIVVDRLPEPSREQCLIDAETLADVLVIGNKVPVLWCEAQGIKA